MDRVTALESVDTRDKRKALDRVRECRYERLGEKVGESRKKLCGGLCRVTGQENEIGEKLFSHALCHPEKRATNF